MALLSALSTALTGKATIALAGAALAGGGVAIAVEADDRPEADPVTEELRTEREELSTGSEDEHTVEVDGSPAGDGALDAFFVEELDTPAEGRAADVHDALTDGEASPGDEDFGRTVADKAREDGRQLGQDVSEAARGDAGDAASDRRRDDHGEAQSEQAPSTNGTDENGASGAGARRDDDARASTPAGRDSGPADDRGAGAAADNGPDTPGGR